jgi:hypothetical protein
MITFSGGEPMLHPELDAMIAHDAPAGDGLVDDHERLPPVARAHPAV